MNVIIVTWQTFQHILTNFDCWQTRS